MKVIYKYPKLETVEVINRPSKNVKSPYLADVKYKDKDEIFMVHSPALGLCGYIRSGSIVAISEKFDCKNTERKTKHTIELVELKNDDNKKLWVGANPCLSNKLFEVMLNKEIIDFVGKVNFMKREYTYEINDIKSRFDFYVENNKNKYIIEVKNVPIVDYPLNKMPEFRKFPIRDGKRKAIFPDGYQSKKGECVSPRALKHLRELVHIKKNVKDIIPALVFIVQREDCYGFSPNFEKDPLYSKELKKAHEEGVIIKAYLMKMSLKQVSFIKELPVVFK